eukprot:s2354_g2.t2
MGQNFATRMFDVAQNLSGLDLRSTGNSNIFKPCCPSLLGNKFLNVGILQQQVHALSSSRSTSFDVRLWIRSRSSADIHSLKSFVAVAHFTTSTLLIEPWQGLAAIYMARIHMIIATLLARPITSFAAELDVARSMAESTCGAGCGAQGRSLLQQNASSTLQTENRGEKADERYALSLLVVRQLRAEDWTTVVLPLIAVVVLVVSFYIFLSPAKAPTTLLPRASVTADSLQPSQRSVPIAPRPSERPRDSRASEGRPSAVPGSAPRPLSMVLCSDLLVQDGLECTLVLPRLALLSTNAQVNVSDTKGGAVFRIKFSLIPDRDGTRLVMSNQSGDMTFATASDSRTVKAGAAQQRSLSIMNPKDPSRQYLLEDKSGGDFQVSNTSGQFIRFISIPGGFNAIDDQDQLLAFLDPPVRNNPGQVARIGPLVDVGLIVMCFLGIGVLTNDKEKQLGKK